MRLGADIAGDVVHLKVKQVGPVAGDDQENSGYAYIQEELAFLFCFNAS